ncbi:hypothetical protein ACU4GD_04400 [Cupriavidus basilensis]
MAAQQGSGAAVQLAQGREQAVGDLAGVDPDPAFGDGLADFLDLRGIDIVVSDLLPGGRRSRAPGPTGLTRTLDVSGAAVGPGRAGHAARVAPSIASPALDEVV